MTEKEVKKKRKDRAPSQEKKRIRIDVERTWFKFNLAEPDRRRGNMTSDAIVSLVLRKLGDLAMEEARFLSGVPDDMKWIQRELTTLQSSLKDADDARHKKNARARNWVQQVREIAYDAEDIIDNFIGEAATGEAYRRGALGTFSDCASFLRKLKTDHTVGVQIQKVKSRISDLSSNKQAFDINAFINEGGGSQYLHQSRRRRAHEEPDMVGMLDDMETLKDRLIDGDPDRRVVSIVGMGGSGKTTLARTVYDEVKNGFECYAFIYVSQHYTPREIFTSLIKSVMVPKPETGEIEKLSDQELEDKLRCYLSGKRYLVVLDDIWSKDAWDEFRFVLPECSKESRVMLTTRKKVVAAHADPSSPPHETRLLNDDEGWELFPRKAFPRANAPIVCPKHLEKIGKDIFAKCHRLPLAIVLLGGLLSTKDKQVHPWSRVLDNVTKRLAESSDELMEILALSYSDLPCYLKPCFLYFGLFRPSQKDEISSKKLIRLWIAEGLISDMSEDRAGDYLEELIDRSMIQVVTRRIDGSVRTCRIHDLLSDLSISEAKENNFFAIQADNGTIEGLSSVRRLTLSCDTEMNEAMNCPIATLRSMLCFSNHAMDLSKLLSRGVKFLRVLEILPRRKVPQNIGDFVNLRYLSLRGGAIKSLPSSIGQLSYLLALELTFTGTLPHEIYDLGRLKHLYTYYYVISGCPRLAKLKNLQTLCLSASSWIEENCLGKLTDLRKLGIDGVLNEHHEALFISIDKLQSLRSLKLVCGNSISIKKKKNSIPQNMPFAHGSHPHLYKMNLEGLMKKLIELPQNLAKLTLSKSELEQDAIDTLEKLPKLETLRLLAGSYCSETMHCSSGGFPQLKFLELDCSHLKKWTAEEGSMPSLKSVELPNRDDLKILPERVRDLLR